MKTDFVCLHENGIDACKFWSHRHDLALLDGLTECVVKSTWEKRSGKFVDQFDGSNKCSKTNH